jgi:hypothetical protein
VFMKDSKPFNFEKQNITPEDRLDGQLITDLFRTVTEATLFADLAPQFGISAQVVTDPETASRMHAEQAVRANYDRGLSRAIESRSLDLTAHAETARQFVEAGGALVSITLQPDQDASRLWAAYNEDKAARDAQTSTGE